ncbi:MAG: FtsB family cell division protein [Balneolaceae bacterium]
MSLLVAFLVVWFSFIDVYSLKTRWELSQRKKELIERTADLSMKSDELKTKLSSLENNQVLLEKIAREQYGMRKPGETVYKIKRK